MPTISKRQLEQQAADYVHDNFYSEGLISTCTTAELSIAGQMQGASKPLMLAIGREAKAWLLNEASTLEKKLFITNAVVGSFQHRVALLCGFKEYTRYNGQDGRIAAMAVKIGRNKLLPIKR